MQSAKQRKKIKPEHHVLGGVRVDVHRTWAADGAQLAVSRIRPRGDAVYPYPVILVHGTYCTRSFWVSSKGIGMGAYLADQGFDVWIPELRGHGLSPKGDSFSRMTAEDQIRYDLPAIQEYVFDDTEASAFWIGHSFGGLYMIAAMSMKWLMHERVKGMATFGSQISLGDRYLKIPPVVWSIRFLMNAIGHLPAPKLGLGPEIEPAGVILETIRWKKLFGKWTDSEGKPYWDGIKEIEVPVITFAAAKDKNDPAEGCKIIHDLYGSRDKIFIILGRNYRFSKDYDHVGMIVSKEARTEVWPDVAGWMRDRS
ncbi:MAG: alpha/beta fold hydrolase [Desulfobacterales bacterium]|jgi:pimeloyl-ACP methyl ester carboxylesterase|nr:alpha/beta fold hydrolase [Desulfobacterales bacterium]